MPTWGLFPEGGGGAPPREEARALEEALEACKELVAATLEATQGQIVSQSPTDATRFWWRN